MAGCVSPYDSAAARALASAKRATIFAVASWGSRASSMCGTQMSNTIPASRRISARRGEVEARISFVAISPNNISEEHDSSIASQLQVSSYITFRREWVFSSTGFSLCGLELRCALFAGARSKSKAHRLSFTAFRIKSLCYWTGRVGLQYNVFGVLTE